MVDTCEYCGDDQYPRLKRIKGEKYELVMEPVVLITYLNEDGTDDHICQGCVEPYEREQMGAKKWNDVNVDIAAETVLIQPSLDRLGTPSPSATRNPALAAWSATASFAISIMRSRASRVGRS